MAFTDINGEDRLGQQTFANHLRKRLGWEGVYAYNIETFGRKPARVGHARVTLSVSGIVRADVRPTKAVRSGAGRPGGRVCAAPSSAALGAARAARFVF